MPEKPTVPDKADEAALAAEVAAEHAEKAVADADKAETVALKAAAEPGAKFCPDCKTELVPHDDTEGAKKGAYHCNGCGVCWAPGLKKPRYPA